MRKKGIKKTRRNRKRRRRRNVFLIICLCGLLLVLNIVGRLDEWISDIFVDCSEEELVEKGYPESLAKLYIHNSEARNFVLGYQNYDGNPDNIDVSREVRKGKVPLFLQWDSRWGYEKYGDDYMALTGCGPTALSMVYTGLTGDSSLHPLNMARLAEENGYYVDGSGSSWNMMTELAESIGLSVWKPSFIAESIIAELEEGNPIICIMGAGDFTATGHFIVLTGVKNGKIIVNDPNSPKHSEKLWEIDTIMKQILDLWAYS